MSTKAILAAVAGAVLAFLLGWVIYGMLLMNFFEANSTHYDGLMKETPNLLLYFISNLIMALLFAYIFEKWAGIKSIGSGIIGAIIIGLPISLSMDLFFIGGMNLFTPTLVVVDVIASTVLWALVGGLIGFILGTGKKASA
jgi:hypothetical protein